MFKLDLRTEERKYKEELYEQVIVMRARIEAQCNDEDIEDYYGRLSYGVMDLKYMEFLLKYGQYLLHGRKTLICVGARINGVWKVRTNQDHLHGEDFDVYD